MKFFQVMTRASPQRRIWRLAIIGRFKGSNYKHPKQKRNGYEKGNHFGCIGGLIHCDSCPAWALFESDRTLSEEATVPMVDAIKTAVKTHPGKPVEVNMGKDDGRVVYKVEIVDAKDTHKVYVDAKTGKVHVEK
ncbi:MAG: PepSY domain-containing protein [Nitrospirales bacterium]|nr:PepSY domain-containing protein [Nitrospirales bacterium]